MARQGETKPAGREGRAAEPAEHNRLLVQRTFFTAPSAKAPDELYCTVEMGVTVRERDRVVLDGHALVSTNTYFGRFPASYWQRWTAASQVRVDAVVSGNGELRVVASDSEGNFRTVASTAVEDAHEAPVRFPVALDRFVDGGGLWLEARTASRGMTVEQVRWSVTSPRQPRPTAVVICTFNRADDCLATLRALGADATVRRFVDAVYVVDQGTDTVESRGGFAAVAEALGSALHYLRQPNLGGAGGFTRGLYEVAEVENAEHANVLFMDDDIMLEPDSVVRMTALADRTVEPTIVGGQMLNLLHPERLHHGAETTDLAVLRAGLPVREALANADMTEENQEFRVDAGYTGWWSCLIPSEVVAAIGYPLPLFFQWDDIEYGLRAAARGFPSVTLPGAGVWHADFTWKNWDDWARYFSFRNSLIVSALHGEFDRPRTAKFLAGELANYLVSMRYGLAATLIKAVEDFLAGPDTLHDGGVEAAAAVRKLRAEYPETSLHPASTVPGVAQHAMPVTPARPKPSMMKAVLAKRSLWQLLRRPHGSAAVAVRDAHWWHVSLFDTAVVTDPSQEGVRVRRLDRELMVSLGRRGAAVLWRLVREGGQAQRQYQQRLPELTSRANWQRLFESH